MRKMLADWRLYWFLLLLPVALLLPAMPIDETRYLSVAWEMRHSGEWLLLHLNGEPYTHKGPLLFWLIDLAWSVAGMHVWVVRLVVLVLSLLSLRLFGGLVRRLAPEEPALAERAVAIFAGMSFFAVFAGAIMFDVVLTACVLLAMHGLADFDARRWGRGVAVFGAGLALGLLDKGPVMLLDAGLAAFLAPWWSATARAQPLRWYGATLLGILVSALAGLGYMLAAGGWGYVATVLVHQTAERMTSSFAHARPIWWYLPVLPLMILPWTLSLRAPWRAWREGFLAGKAARLGLVWFVPAFVLFSFSSGKQPHYLLPLLPGLAICLAQVQGDAAACVRGRAFGILLLIAGLALFATPWIAPHIGSLSALERQVLVGVWPLWGALMALLGAFLLAHRRSRESLRALALGSAAAAAIGMLTLAQAVGPTLDVSATAARIHAAQDAGRSVVHIGWHHGLFGFPGRLTRPLEAVDLAHLYVWCAKHPDGEALTFYNKYDIPVKPELTVPWRLGQIRLWRAADLCAGPHAAPPKGGEEDASED